MTERPILMSGAMVRARLREVDPKTQTRRVVMPQPPADFKPQLMSLGWFWVRSGELVQEHRPFRCPYGAAGDRLWVRETLGVTAQGDCEYMADRQEIDDPRAAALCERYGDSYHFSEVKGVPSIFMPRWACRLVLEVTDVRVERLQDITWKDAFAEGFEPQPVSADPHVHRDAARDWYMDLWDELNAERGFGWKVNPYVWVVSFRRAAALR